MKIHTRIIILATILSSACDPKPIFETSKELIPPSDEAGISCFKKTSKKKEECNKQYRKELSNCKIKAKGIAKLTMIEKEKEYISSFNQYSQELELYHKENFIYERQYKKTNKLYKKYSKKCKNIDTLNSEFCEKKDSLFFRLENIELNMPISPKKPKKPDLKLLTSEEEEFCLQKNRCNTSFEESLISCGGKIIINKKCIKHCGKSS